MSVLARDRLAIQVIFHVIFEFSKLKSDVIVINNALAYINTCAYINEKHYIYSLKSTINVMQLISRPSGLPRD
jgi:hypothetical protein